MYRAHVVFGARYVGCSCTAAGASKRVAGQACACSGRTVADDGSHSCTRRQQPSQGAAYHCCSWMHSTSSTHYLFLYLSRDFKAAKHTDARCRMLLPLLLLGCLRCHVSRAAVHEPAAGRHHVQLLASVLERRPRKMQRLIAYRTPRRGPRQQRAQRHMPVDRACGGPCRLRRWRDPRAVSHATRPHRLKQETWQQPRR